MRLFLGGILNHLESGFTRLLYSLDTRLVEFQNAISALCLGLVALVEKSIKLPIDTSHFHLNLGILLSALLLTVGLLKLYAVTTKQGAHLKVWASLLAGTAWVWASTLFFFVSSPLLAFTLPLALMSFLLFICHGIKGELG